MSKDKNLSAVVGITGFLYAKLKKDTTDGFEYGEIVRVPYAQNVSIESEQEIAKAYGDNTVAEMAVSTGVTTAGFQFHTIPLEDRIELLGLENDDDGLIVQKSQVNPPYVAVALEKTKADGTSELVGLTKGMFTLPSDEAETKEDTLEFGSDEIEGEFSARVHDDVAQIFAHIGKDDKEKRDAFMKKVFGKSEENEEDEGNEGP